MEANINNIIKERRSIYPREFSGKMLDDNIIQTLLENANYAPNHKSNYPWRFIIIKDNALKSWIEKASELYKTQTSADKFKQEKMDKTLNYQHQVSHAIAIVCHREPQGSTIAIEDHCAVAAAVQNMYLSLHQFPNAGGYWSTGLGTYSKPMHEFLGLGENDLLMGYFVLGHVEQKRTEGMRKKIEHFVSTLNL